MKSTDANNLASTLGNHHVTQIFIERIARTRKHLPLRCIDMHKPKYGLDIVKPRFSVDHSPTLLPY